MKESMDDFNTELEALPEEALSAIIKDLSKKSPRRSVTFGSTEGMSKLKLISLVMDLHDEVYPKRDLERQREKHGEQTPLANRIMGL